MSIDSSDYTGTQGQKPWLCILNEVTDSVITASGALVGYEAEAIRGPQTYSAWAPPTLPAWVRAEFATPTDGQINYVMAYISDGGGCLFQPEYWSGSAWVAIGQPATVATGQRECLLWILDTVATDSVRLTVDGDSNSAQAYVATVKAGMATIMPYCPPVGYAPAYLNPMDTYTNTFSEGGQILGSQLISSMASEALSWSIMPPDWVRSVWTVIRPLMRTEGVCFAWRPVTYPQELIYGMVTGTPAVNYASHVRMGVSFTIEGPSP